MSAGVGVALSPIFEDKVHFPGYLDNRVDLYSSESILIYLSVAGSVIPIRVLESDSIASVKLRIQTCKGFVVKKQKLVYGGRELARKDTLVKDYGVSGGDVLHLVLKLSDLLAIIVSTMCGQEFELQVDRYRNVGYLRQRIFKEAKGVVDLKDQELFCHGEKLDDQRLINDISKNNDGVIHLLIKKSAKVRAIPIEKDVELSVVASDIRPKDERDECEKQSSELCVVSEKLPDKDFLLESVIVNPKIRLPSALWDMIKSACDGLNKGNLPIRSTEGTGGAYFMLDPSGQKILAVFKPTDEEPKAVNNPQGLPISEDGEGLKKGTRVGEGALREVAAYLLDHRMNGPRSSSDDVIGFSGAPPTAMVRCLHKGFNHPEGYEGTLKNVKIGSLQMFRENDGNCEDIGPQAFPVEEVHKISVLDIRLANADRHAGNILYKKNSDTGQIELFPIDHGYCLPDSFEECTFDWLYWPQAHQPFSSETLNYIKLLDAEKDLDWLKFNGWKVPIEAARTLRISTMLLKKGAEKGLTPFAIGNIMCRETLNDPSMIEEIVSEAQQSLLPGMSEEDFLEAVSCIMDFHLAKVN
ncbi:phosphatidylinositol 4-kinase gamma 4-like [Amaranthus tricolor]|uniref:phosphatidylinositol 4-kinase gamma 4-like n=1 Tax=Amaranthus tricolor TaxID=29722 RepID=UPI002582F748|nr:phosphatidylinositol 4-kinase gamma 4-like [Amaranthus tricolor]XP_057519190.1 phosphatidylinositol 4-kinase gamma 4-like [Amaranthus tricolor]